MNVADSDMVTAMLAKAGYRKTVDPGDADVILVNTCAVRERAEQRVYARARELSAYKKRRPGVVLAITGCMAEHLKERLLSGAPQVDVVLGPDGYRRLLPMIERARVATPGSATQLDTQLDKTETYEGLSGAEGGDGVSGFVTIQRGCDKFCTFCVVPYTRGRERGVAPREVLRRSRAAGANGQFVPMGRRQLRRSVADGRPGRWNRADPVHVTVPGRLRT
jgi:tRNA-2-methylthio-N6-dimethylallyladenosine synthase